jgi:hypothetical protein
MRLTLHALRQQLQPCLRDKFLAIFMRTHAI